MKKDIHPTYYSKAKITCICGNEIITGSTQKEQKVDICSSCHPFYTGKQKLVDTAGRVEKFKAKVEAAKKHEKDSKEKEESVPKKKKDGKYMTIEEIQALKQTAPKGKKKKTAEKPAKKTSTKTTKKSTAKEATLKTSAKATKKTATKPKESAKSADKPAKKVKKSTATKK